MNSKSFSEPAPAANTASTSFSDEKSAHFESPPPNDFNGESYPMDHGFPRKGTSFHLHSGLHSPAFYGTTPMNGPHSVRSNGSGLFVHHFGEGGWTPSVVSHHVPGNNLMQYLDLGNTGNSVQQTAQMSSPIGDHVEPPGFPPMMPNQSEAEREMQNGSVSTPHFDLQGYGWGNPFQEWSDGYGPWAKPTTGMSSFALAPSPSVHLPAHMGGSITPFPPGTNKQNHFGEQAPAEDAPASPPPERDLWKNVSALPPMRPLSDAAATTPVTPEVPASPEEVTPPAARAEKNIETLDWDNDSTRSFRSSPSLSRFDDRSPPAGVGQRVATPAGRHAGTAVSIGSASHPQDCRPCAFFWTKGCINGGDCRFCHEWHPPKKKKPMKEQKNLMIIARPDGKIEFMRCTVSEALRVL